MNIYRVTQIDDKIVAAFARLIPQLGDNLIPPTREDLQMLAASDNSYLFVVESNDSIVGSLTLAFYRIPTGVRVWIEDVVVDERERGRKIGEKLVEFALQFAREHGFENVNLTSRSQRVAANKLYQKLGFKLRETNMYRLEL